MKRDPYRELERRRVWDEYLDQLRSANGYVDVMAMLEKAPRQSKPGREYYANLGFFMHSFSIPSGASATELVEFRRLLERMNEEGVIKEGHYGGLAEAFDRAIARED